MAQIPPKMHPSFHEVMQSRRLRSGALVAAVFLIILYTAHHHNIISTGIPTTNWRVPSPLPDDVPAQHYDEVDWSRFAYVQYVTNAHYLCNSVMIFESLHRLGSKADRVMLHPSDMTTDNNQLLCKARDDYEVKLVPIKVHSKHTADSTVLLCNLCFPPFTSKNPLTTRPTRAGQQLGPNHSPSFSLSTRPTTTESSTSIPIPSFCNPWTSSSSSRPAPSPCPAPTGSTPTFRSSRRS